MRFAALFLVCILNTALSVANGDSGCGLQPTVRTFQPVFGRREPYRVWPWQLAIFELIEREDKSKVQYYRCGGTLVSLKHVVTAARCDHYFQADLLKDVQKIRVNTGQYNLFVNDEYVQVREVSRVHLPPGFKEDIQRPNLIVLELSSPVTYTEFVRPVCLPTSTSTPRDLTGRVVAWGSQVPGVHTELELAVMRVSSRDACLGKLPAYRSEVREDEFCAITIDKGTTPCLGDIGSGMFVPSYDKDRGTTVWRHHGVMSGIDKTNAGVCIPEKYTIFTDVTKFASWLNDVISGK